MKNLFSFFVSFIFSISNNVAFSTSSFDSFANFNQTCVFFIEFMAMYAVSLKSIYRRICVAAKSIFFRSHRFEMIGIYAKRISTNMIDLKSFRNRSFYEFIAELQERAYEQ